MLHIVRQEDKRVAREEIRDEKIDLIVEELGKYKGFVGGVLFLAGCIWAFIKMGIPVVMKLLGKN